MMSPRERYQRDLQRPGFVRDEAQARAVERLQDLYERLLNQPVVETDGVKGWWNRVRGVRPEPERGLYLWGGVGRGKTYLVDAFFDALPFPEKRRLHFHRFMREVHGRLRHLREFEDPLIRVAEEWAADTRVLCFDEFFVSDIGDAMILSGLLRGLFANGVTLVATSNIPPDGLYQEGLQRVRFLPAIKLLKQHVEVLNVDGGEDYRLRFLEQAEIYHTPLDEAADRVLADNFAHVCAECDDIERDTRLNIEGRSIAARRVGSGAVWFDFEAICDGPRGQADYIEIAQQFHTVLISGVPVFRREHEDQARRFISLVDEFYDRGVKLILSAETGVDELYQGRRLQFEFQRTVSRLVEMQSRDYLARPHKP
jgi:cell division protein ZapE